MQFLIGGIKKSSLLDFPNKISAIVFTQGCNFNCGFCHNPKLLKIVDFSSNGDNNIEYQKTVRHLYTSKAIEYAKELRKNMTPTENILWYYLRKRQMCGIKFRRQSPIGKYIVDFVSYENKLVIEIDGGEHMQVSSVLHDKLRDEFLMQSGYTVKRYNNNDINNNIESVLEDIYNYCVKKHMGEVNNSENEPPTSTLPLKGEGSSEAYSFMKEKFWDGEQPLFSPSLDGEQPLFSPSLDGEQSLFSPSPLEGEGRGGGSNPSPNPNTNPNPNSTFAFFNFLKTRKGKLDGVVITGGEPTIQKDLKLFIQEIKNMGFDVKLDTNGYRPDVLIDLINDNLLDYIAMDIKAPLEKYSIVVNREIDTKKIQQSIDIIMKSKVDYEFRTTFMPYYHEIKDFEKIAQLIKGAKRYYLQRFEVQSEINKTELRNEKNYSEEDIEKIKSILKPHIQSVELR